MARPLLGTHFQCMLSYMAGAPLGEYICRRQRPPRAGGDGRIHCPRRARGHLSRAGPMPHAIQEIERRAVLEWRPSSDYEYADMPDIGVYLHPEPKDIRFGGWLPAVPTEK